MPDLPSGTVTFLFSDIEGSTNLLRELGDEYAAALEAHRDVVRAAFGTHGGVEVDTQGDAFFGAFARASDAVAAADEIQRELASGPVRVRIGVHTGEPQITDEGYVGLDVHRGARVCAAGHGGQVLLTQPTRELVDVQASDLGEHRLKDLLEPQRLFQLGTESFPPLKTLDWTNLPVQATPLVGREEELADAMALLKDQRLLTLVGPPGTGKTRLALQLAAEVADEFEHVWWVALDQIHDPQLVEATIAQTIGARDDLAGFLRDRRALLLLDNLEQVLDFAPRLAELVAGAGNLKLIATSREPLRLTLEQQYPVPPLPEDDAMALFGERARAVRPGFAANGAVAEICRRLDGLPLAIELAAARVKILLPDALLARLEQRLPLLAGGARDAPERQQTLRTAIAWSYDLLEEQEQQKLARLSAFAGGCTLEAAEGVCDCDLETLASLVDKSLVREQDGRFSMLETIREFSRERLTELEPDGASLRRHAEYFLEQARVHSNRRVDAMTLEEFEYMTLEEFEWFVSEHDNLRTALDWWHEQESAEPELQLANACSEFWDRGGFWTEGRQRFEAALGRADESPADVRAGAARRLSFVVVRQGDYVRAKQLAESAISCYQQSGTNPGELRHAYIILAICEQKLGNGARSREIYEAIRADADERSLAIILGNLGNMDLDEHNYAGARSNIEAAAAIHRRVGPPSALANDILDLGFIALADARIDEAVPLLRESLAICRAERRGDLLPWAVEAVAAVAPPDDAVRLLAATTKPREELAMGIDFYPIAEEIRERTLDRARAQLSESAFAAAWAQGDTLSLEEAAEQAARI
jgi:predicted ATPase